MNKRLFAGVLIIGATMLALSGGDNSLVQMAMTVVAVLAAIGAGVLLAPTMLNSDEPTDTPYT